MELNETIDKNYRTLCRKDYGRIFVEKEEDIQKVKNIMLEIDEYETEKYLPEELITTYKPENKYAVYTHKFNDMDMGLVQLKAFEQGIKIIVWNDRMNMTDNI